MRRAAALLLLLAVACSHGPASGTTTSFLTKDGFTLTGEEFGSGSRGVVLAPAEGGNRTAWRAFAGRLANEGFHVLVFDYRAPDTFARADRDVSAAGQYLHDRGVDRLACVGASAGGLACLKAGAQGLPQLAVATVSAPAEYQGLAVGSEASTITAPKFFQAADGDAATVAAAQTFLQTTAEPRTLTTYPGAAHGLALLNSNGRAADDLLAFLKGALP